MSRKEASNTWHDGLVMDLNPMNTPNSVLTDNLNGTIITYNGNEHLLQNDMGNYKLKNCRLSENFVPVGLKEYGDILYIVSYNPITEETEIGSYPSPAQINSATPSTVEDQGRQSVILKTLEQDGYVEYLNTDKNNYSIVFADEKMKLHPGDKYDLKRITSEDYPKYEGNDYYILDEENRFHDITDFIESDLNDKGYKFVPWDVPGWMCIKSKVFNFDKYTMSITEFNKLNDKLTVGVRGKLYVNDPIFINKYISSFKSQEVLSSFINDLSVCLKIFVDGNVITDLNLNTALNDNNLSIQSYDWYDGGIIVQFDYVKQFTIDTSGNSIIKITSVPFITESTKYSIVYSHLLQTIESNIDNIITATAGSIKADGVYKFYRDNSSEDSSGNGNTMKLYVDLVATDSSQIVVVDDDFKLYLTLFDLSGKKIESIPLTNDIVIGQNGTPVQNEFTFSLSPNQREEIYDITLTSMELNYSTYSSAVKDNVEFIKFKNTNKYPIITSTVFEKYIEDYEDFTSIPMKTWVNGYVEQIMDDGELKISNITINDKTYSSSYIENSDFRQVSDKDFIGFVDANTSISLTPEIAKLGVKYSVSFDVSSNTIEENISKYIIGMWTGLISSSDNYTLLITDEDGNNSEITLRSSNNPNHPYEDDSDSDSDSDWDSDQDSSDKPWFPIFPFKPDKNEKAINLKSNSFDLTDDSYQDTQSLENQSQIGTWDVSTGNKSGSKINFETNYIVNKQYDYELIDTLEKFCKYTVKSFTSLYANYSFFSAIAHPNKDTMETYGLSRNNAAEKKWLWVSGSGTNTAYKYPSIKLEFDWDTQPSAKLFHMPANVSYITGRIAKDQSGDYTYITKYVNGEYGTILGLKDNSRNIVSKDIYFLAIKAAESSNKVVLIHVENATSAVSIYNDLSDSKWVSSTNSDTLKTYNVYSLVEGDVIEKYIETPILKYNLKTHESWNYNKLDLLKYNDSPFDLLKMSEWESKQSSLQASIPITYPTTSEFPFTKENAGCKSLAEYDSDILTIKSTIRTKLDTINSEIDLSRSDFRGFYPGSSNLAKSLAPYLNYNNGSVTCNFNPNDKLYIRINRSGNLHSSSIGYYLDI